MSTFANFFSSRKFVASLNANATFIGLIPKKINVDNKRDFRPINLVGCIYKLLSKVSARRLRSTIRSLILENQNAFMGGRHSLEAMHTSNELINSGVRSGPEVVSWISTRLIIM